MLPEARPAGTLAPTPAAEALLFGPAGPALFRLGSGHAVAVPAVCSALEIPAEEELDRLRAARWADLDEVLVTEADGSAAVVPVLHLAAARLWLVGLDGRRVAPAARRWLEGLQAEAVELFEPLPD